MEKLFTILFVLMYAYLRSVGRLTVSQRYQERFGGRRRRRQFVDSGVADGCHPLAAAACHCIPPAATSSTVFARVTAHDDDDDDDDRRLLPGTSAFPPYCCSGSHHMTTMIPPPPPAPPPTRVRFASPRERQIRPK